MEKTRLFVSIFAALQLLASGQDAQAQSAPGAPISDDKVRTDTGVTGQPTVQSALEFHLPAAPSMKDVDSTKVPSPYVAPANHDAYIALEGKMTGDVSKALDTMGLTGDQRIMVRNYMGQFDHDNQVVSSGFINGVQTFAIKNRETGDYVGQVILRHAEDDAVEVDKVYAAEFETKKTVDLAVPTNVLPEQVRQALGNSEETRSLSRDVADGKVEVSMPLIKAKAGVDVGLARESTAVFNSDGSGKEYVFTTKIASAAAEAKVTTEGISGGIGAKGPEAEIAVTYFGPPKVSAEGELTRSEFGGKLEAHGTVANIDGKAGCDDEKGCGASWSVGGFGVGAGAELVSSPAKKVEFDADVGEEHPTSAAEESAYRQAVASGTPEALGNFTEKYPDSEHIDEVSNLIEKGAASEAPTPVADETAPKATTDATTTAATTDAATATETPASASEREQKAYEAAVSDGSAEALQSFLDEYPNSGHDDDVKKREASAPDSPNPNTPEPESPSPEDANDGKEGGTGY
jgi:hypothetical protein